MLQTTAGVHTAEMDRIFAALARSSFRASFRLRPRERAYLREKGLPEVMKHAAGFIAERLAPADIPNDGKQTPYRNHPVFVAQHATATCCRRCLAKWHRIPAGHHMSAAEQDRVLAVIARWLGERSVDG